MKIRIKKLWQLPLYYLAASFLSFYPLLWLLSLFTVRTESAGGAVSVEINPLLRFISGFVIVLIVIIAGGLWICRRLSGREIIVSSLIISLFYFLWVLSELLFPGWDSFMPFAYYFFTLNAELSALISSLGLSTEISSLLSSFSPMLFCLFSIGKNKK